MKTIEKKLNSSKLTREHFENSLHKFCRDVDYYTEKEMSEKEAIRYVKYWYQRKEKQERKFNLF